MANRVTFAGQLQRQEVEELYRRAACVVVPSRAPETFGLVGPEALIHGTPVVASRAGGAGEWALEGETALTFEPDDLSELLQAVTRILGDPAAAQDMALRGRNRCMSEFSLEPRIDALIGLFHQLVAH